MSQSRQPAAASAGAGSGDVERGPVAGELCYVETVRCTWQPAQESLAAASTGGGCGRRSFSRGREALEIAERPGVADPGCLGKWSDDRRLQMIRTALGV